MTIPNLSSLTNVDLFQSGSIQVHHKQTSQEVLAHWDEQMTAINDIINIESFSGFTAADQITEAQRAALEASLGNLITLARDGFTYSVEIEQQSGPPINQDVRDVITVEMAKDLDNLLRTIESAHPGAQFVTAPDILTGNPVTTITLPLEAVKAWRDFAEATPVINQIVQHMNDARSVGGVYNVNGNYLDGAIGPDGRLRVGSLQSMVELLYVKTGNELMADNLEQLEEALSINKQSLEVLTSLQSMHNNIAAFSKGEPPEEVGVISTELLFFGNPTESITRNLSEEEIANGYTAQGGKIEAYFDSIVPELGPGMASAYDILEAYKKASDPLNAQGATNSVFSDLSVEIKNQLAAAQTAIINDPTGAAWDAIRPDLASAVIKYRELVVPYNAAITKLNELIAPFAELLGTAPGSQITISDPTLGIVTFPLPLELQDMPTFSSDQIPYPVGSNSARTQSSYEQVLAFANGALDDSIDALGTIADGYVPPEITTNQISTFGDALYQNSKILNGDPARGLSPIANIDMAVNIREQYQLLQSQIQFLKDDPNQLASSNTLLARLNTVVNDLKAAGIDDLPTASQLALVPNAAIKAQVEQITEFANKWILDGLDLENNSSSGKIQENLGFAIAASESLNDQQKEETRRFLFLFEEFYKSASAILTKITQLLEKMAQNINR